MPTDTVERRREDGMATPTKRAAAIGECMLELTHRDDHTLSLGFAGDTFNTAVYLAALSDPQALQVDYVTRIGDDWYSQAMAEEMRRCGLGTRLVERVAGGTPGAYFVRTDAHGERSFTYHRSMSPARDLFGPECSQGLDDELAGYDVLYVSAITLQILSGDGRERLWRLLSRVRGSGGIVVFDSNYRPQGWSSDRDARAAIGHTLRHVDVAIPTFGDEHFLFGDVDPVASARRISAQGVREVVVKDGARPCVVSVDGVVHLVAPESPAGVVDTTGAGDSFNGGYLAARLTGAEGVQAARAGHSVAAEVIGEQGAIAPWVREEATRRERRASRSVGTASPHRAG